MCALKITQILAEWLFEKEGVKIFTIKLMDQDD
jgi:hypothetical protein